MKAACLLAAASLLGTATAAVVSSPAAASITTASTCTPWGTLAARGGGTSYLVVNKPSVSHNDLGMCVSNRGGWPGFTVTKSPGPAGNRVRAYPFIGLGCFARECSPGHPAPRKAGSLGTMSVSWSVRTTGVPGVWNAALDLWLGPRSGDGACELMIWLRYSKPGWWRRLPVHWIDGWRWQVVTMHPSSGRWYISFHRVRQGSSVSGLRLEPFMKAAIARRTLTAGDLLWETQAGFEIWGGGKGLATLSFKVTS
jgi:hypothetical protein